MPLVRNGEPEGEDGQARTAPRRGRRLTSKAASIGVAILVVTAILIVPIWMAMAATQSGSSGGAPADEPVVFTVGSIEEVDTLNPMLTVLPVALLFDTYLYDSITTSSPEDLSPMPGLAESWDHAEDGLSWTYHLRPGLRWSDGEPLTAEDASYTLNRILDGGPGQGTWGTYLQSVSRVVAIDEVTLRLTLKEPSAVLPRMPVPILPKHVLELYSDDELAEYPMQPDRLVSSGPFRLLEGEAGDSVFRFATNPDNWRGPSKIDLLTWRFFKAEDTVMQALIKGDVDYTTGISALQARALQTYPGIEAGQYNELGAFREIGFNTGSVDLETGEPIGDPSPAVLDPRFRAALSSAIDREAIVEKAFKGAATPLNSVMASGFDKYRWSPPAGTEFDPSLARRALDEAGYTVGADGKRTLPDGTPIGTLRLAIDSGDTTSRISSQLIREWLEDIGLSVRVDAMTTPRLSDVILGCNYDMFEWGWAIDDDPDSIPIYFTCEQRGLWSDSWYCNDEYDRLYAEQKREIDPQARIEKIQEIQEILHRDAPYIVTVGTQSQQAYRVDRFHGYRHAFTEGGDVLFDVDAYFALTPGPEPGQNADGGSSASRANPALIYGAIVVALLVIAIAYLAVKRYRASTAEERE